MNDLQKRRVILNAVLQQLWQNLSILHHEEHIASTTYRHIMLLVGLGENGAITRPLLPTVDDDHAGLATPGDSSSGSGHSDKPTGAQADIVAASQVATDEKNNSGHQPEHPEHPRAQEEHDMSCYAALVEATMKYIANRDGVRITDASHVQPAESTSFDFGSDSVVTDSTFDRLLGASGGVPTKKDQPATSSLDTTPSDAKPHEVDNLTSHDIAPPRDQSSSRPSPEEIRAKFKESIENSIRREKGSDIIVANSYGTHESKSSADRRGESTDKPRDFAAAKAEIHDRHSSERRLASTPAVNPLSISGHWISMPDSMQSTEEPDDDYLAGLHRIAEEPLESPWSFAEIPSTMLKKSQKQELAMPQRGATNRAQCEASIPGLANSRHAPMRATDESLQSYSRLYNAQWRKGSEGSPAHDLANGAGSMPRSGLGTRLDRPSPMGNGPTTFEAMASVPDRFLRDNPAYKGLGYNGREH